MKKVKTEAEFEGILLLEKSMVFVFFEWSGQAQVSKKVLSEWESKSKLEIPLFELDPDELMSVSNWVRDEAKERGGYGSITWLKDGTVLGTEKKAGRFSILELERKTSEIFQN
jgi:hypothetical protein